MGDFGVFRGWCWRDSHLNARRQGVKVARRMSMADVKKLKVLKVLVERVTDTDADTSTIGKYTDDLEEWAIICRTREFVHKVNQRNAMYTGTLERIDELKERAYPRGSMAQNGLLQRIGQLHKRLAWIKESGDMDFPERGREYRCFLAYGCGEKEGSLTYKKIALQQFKRMESLNDGHWCFVGIIAKAQVWNPGTEIVQTLHSGGLWGIESDSSQEYIDEVVHNQLCELGLELVKYGVGPRAGAYAIKQWDGGFVDK